MIYEVGICTDCSTNEAQLFITASKKNAAAIAAIPGYTHSLGQQYEERSTRKHAPTEIHACIHLHAPNQTRRTITPTYVRAYKSRTSHAHIHTRPLPCSTLSSCPNTSRRKNLGSSSGLLANDCDSQCTLIRILPHSSSAPA